MLCPDKVLRRLLLHIMRAELHEWVRLVLPQGGRHERGCQISEGIFHRGSQVREEKARYFVRATCRLNRPGSSRSWEFMVQDFKGFKTFHEGVPEALKLRICFETQDILQPDAHFGADVYLLRSIPHDWSDKYAVLILKNLVPALKGKARVLIADFIGPETTQSGPMWLERLSTIRSMQMKTAVNAPERSEKDWIDMIKRADERYSVEAVVTPQGTAMSVFEIVFNASG
ncbi:uncharacterized protein BO97DRAFT_173868 [Aspergillus homomorphus CBS 101889]|uniref:O-methyltransferase C-terminal domain-containing protein n=1 Tax=Aspergillus homomorphus (strain CBS 101889) TaxID=1450537 RepID=A0A395I668_ASPHC|nr:hypothetical protein BO97DRAFT_173868 [Aspergillus homomorphus CBS 101889]RAL15721.1 hypothetical protein BO97DRAFT_173868 [Aspergillus homomorphus CBS 101889]